MEVDKDYSNLGHNVDNFKIGAKVAMEFQINSRNFKASKKIDAIKAHLFRLLGVYLVDNPSNETMSTPKKRHPGNNKWIITPLQIKKTFTSINPLESTIHKF